MTYRSLKPRPIWRLAQGLLGVGAIVGGVFYARWIASMDPLAGYRGKRDPNMEAPGITMGNVRISMFDGQRAAGYLKAKQMDVTRDRSSIQLTDVMYGDVTSDRGTFHIQANSAEYSQRRQQLAAYKGTRVWNQDMDLKLDGFTYSRRTGRLSGIGRVMGRIGGGEILATNFNYFANEDRFEAGPVEWKGDISKVVGDVPGLQQSRSMWQIKGDNWEAEGDINTFTNGRATDGEVIVLAKKIELNKKTDVIVATGDVKYFSARTNMICEQVTVYRKEKRAVLTGNVTMLVKPKDQEKLEEAEIPPFRPIVPESISANRPAAPTEKEKQADKEVQGNTARKYPTQIWAEKIVYWYKKGERRAEITGKPQARQDLPEGRWRHIWTVKGFYDDQAQTLRMESTPGKKDTRYITSLGDNIIATFVLVSTDESKPDKMSAGQPEGDVAVDDDDVNSRKTTGGGGGNPPPLSGPIGRRAINP